MLAKFGTNAGGATWWSNVELIQVEPLFGWRDNSSYRLYTLGPLCLWQCLKMRQSRCKPSLQLFRTPESVVLCLIPLLGWRAWRGHWWMIGIGGSHPALYFPSQIQRDIVQRCATVSGEWWIYIWLTGHFLEQKFERRLFSFASTGPLHFMMLYYV